MDEQGWPKLNFKEKLERVYKLREIWQILNLLVQERGEGEKITQYEGDDFVQIKEIMQYIQARMIFSENWPESFFRDKAGKDDVRTYKQAWGQLKKSWGNLPTTYNLEVDDLLGKMAVNIHDQKYKDEQISEINTIIADSQKTWQGKEAHESILSVSLISSKVMAKSVFS